MALKRVLVFGDTHIPTRADSIPESFDSRIRKTHYDMALVTGDLVEEAAMRSVLPPLPQSFIVQGNMDVGAPRDFHCEVTVDELVILLLHGTELRPRGNIEQLSEIAAHVGADITVHGHTHEPTVKPHAGRLFLNPGTVTGATGGWGGRKDASFIELEIDRSSVKVTLYLTNWKTDRVSTALFRKSNGAMTSL
ncbi:MAG: YfcE family phosphodiesterase [Candidatus Thorarchaeota archaeon]|nr:YfcE family phosphodiesterase [Candidatus Thorarchaeota archaeon]